MSAAKSATIDNECNKINLAFQPPFTYHISVPLSKEKKQNKKEK